MVTTAARPSQRAGRNPLRHGTTAAALLCAAVLTTACAPTHRTATRPVPAAPTATRPASSRTAATKPGVSAAAAQYLTIARAGNRHLDRDFDRLEDRDHDRLPEARADLRDAASTERLFDRRLRRIAFPRDAAPIARHLYRVNQARAALTTKAAAATSVRRLHHYLPLLTAANEPVEHDVKSLRHHLGLPPPPVG